jgi:transposase
MVSKTESGDVRSKHQRGTTLNHCVGIDVSLEVDADGKIAREGKVASELDTLMAWLKGLKLELTRIGLEAGPLSQWLYATMRQAGLAVERGGA